MDVTIDKSTWHEDSNEEFERRQCHADTDHATLRKLFPMSLKLREHDPRNAWPVGTILRYARARQIPSVLPFEALNVKRSRHAIYLHSTIFYNPQEAELIPAIDPA